MSSPNGSFAGIFAPVAGLSRRRQARSYAGMAGTAVGARSVAAGELVELRDPVPPCPDLRCLELAALPGRDSRRGGQCAGRA